LRRLSLGRFGAVPLLFNPIQFEEGLRRGRRLDFGQHGLNFLTLSSLKKD